MCLGYHSIAQGKVKVFTMKVVHQSRSGANSTDSPRVSIGLPVYNGDKFLAEALNSLLAQTYTDFEIIVADNCSTDQTAAIAQRYAKQDSRVRYVRRTENQGAVENFNFVVSQARGEYFKWAAHDDLIAPTYLERCMSILEADESVVLCHSDTQLISQDGTPLAPLEDGSNHFFDELGRIIYLGKDSQDRRFNSARASERFRAIILETDWVFEIFGVFRKEALERTGLLDRFYGSDKLLLAQLVMLGRIILVQEPLFLNRRHADQSMSRATIEGQEVWVDTRAKQSGLMHRLRRMRGFTSAALSGKAPLRERIASLNIVVGYYVRFKRWHDMLEELSGLRMRRISKKASLRMQQLEDTSP
ncbi:MAG: glycosyltransferase [Chloroflexi bacterium]|nr:glycosyltransferase [Chloroflexota bacterium]